MRSRTNQLRLRHLIYAGAWKKFEFLWDLIIRAEQVNKVLPLLESVLDGFSKKSAIAFPSTETTQTNQIPSI